MGLACSEAISSALNGDITLAKSKRGLTVFAFKIPVKVAEGNKKMVPCKDYTFEPNFLTNKKFSGDIKDLLKKRNVQGIKELEF